MIEKGVSQPDGEVNLSQNQQKPFDDEPHKGKEEDDEGYLFQGRESADDTAPQSLEDPDWSPRPETDWCPGY